MSTLTGFLIDRTIRFTQPSAFNDPFELVPLLYVPEGFPKQTVTYEFSLLASRRPINVVYTKDSEDRCSDEHTRELRRILDHEVGFLSLSKTWSSLPMWAHYADEYSGAVIEFDGNHEFFSGAFDIQYADHRPIRNLPLYLSNQIPIAEMCDKSIQWEYEEEVRVARRLSDCTLKRTNGRFPTYVMSVPVECITCVILGERADFNDSKKIFDLIKDKPTIAIHYSMLNHWDYTMSRHLHKLSTDPASLVFRVLPSI